MIMKRYMQTMKENYEKKIDNQISPLRWNGPTCPKDNQKSENFF